MDDLDRDLREANRLVGGLTAFQRDMLAKVLATWMLNSGERSSLLLAIERVKEVA